MLAFGKIQHSNGLENKEKKMQKKIITILSLLNWTKKHSIIYIWSPVCSSWLLWYIRKFCALKKAMKACVLVSLLQGKLALYSPAVAVESQLRKHLLSLLNKIKLQFESWEMQGWLAGCSSNCSEWWVCKEILSPVSCFALESVPVRKFPFADSLHSSPTVSEHYEERSREILNCSAFEQHWKSQRASLSGKAKSLAICFCLSFTRKTGAKQSYQSNFAIWVKQLIWMWKARK